VYGEAAYLTLLHRRQDLFDPRMLERHLGGYTPAQSETDRFRNDPLQAHFSASHVTTLAKSYGYELKLGLRRVDAPGADGDEKVLNPVLSAILEPQYLGLVDKRRIEIAEIALCPVPKPGATLAGLEPLAPQAWYEVYVKVKAVDPDLADSRLPGTTFKTSRWFSPVDMLAGLGFTSPAGPPTGDLSLAAAPALPVALGEDARFEAALDGLGLDGWPLAGEPRVSVLWLRDGAGWKCAGLLVESPEPIHRPGRCELEDLVLEPPAGVTFTLARSDRNSSRLLFLASTPFTPAGPSSLVLELVDRASGATVSGSVTLGAQPAFGDEP
jgi:hypothetical protein